MPRLRTRFLPALDHPSLLKRADGPRIGILRLPRDGSSRPFELSHGLLAVLGELSYYVAGECSPAEIDQFDIVLASFVSPRDAFTFCQHVREPPRRARLIVGGSGVYGFLGWRGMVSRVMFGRAEGIVDDLILGGDPSIYCYDRELDPQAARGPYFIRRPRYLVPGEASVGCGGSCAFCQYRAVRPWGSGGFRDTGLGKAVTEDRWQDLTMGPGRLMTALDGWSEETRRRVKKPVADDQIVETLSRLVEATVGKAPAIVKVFQIVGYPWETEETVRADVLRFRALLGRVRPAAGGRVVLMFQNTPFLPEPLTEMEAAPCNIMADWLGVLRGEGPDGLRVVYDGPSLNAYNRPQIYGPRMRLERVAVARGVPAATLRAMGAARTLEAAMGLADGIWEQGAGEYVSRILRVEPRV